MAGDTYREEVDRTGNLKVHCCIHPWIFQMIQTAQFTAQRGQFDHGCNDVGGPANRHPGSAEIASVQVLI
jgi:hypothetical protein